MEPLVYYHGYDYSTGILAVGAPCVAPILELTNKLPEELHVSWQSRTLIGDDALVSDPAAPGSDFSNRIILGVGELTLITNFYARAGFYRSILRLETASSGVDYYVLNFSAEAGYYLTWLQNLYCACPCEDAHAYDVYAKALDEHPPFSPSFAGSQRPVWGGCVIFPVAIRRVPPRQMRPDFPLA